MLNQMGCSNPPVTAGLHLFESPLPKWGSMKGGWVSERENIYERQKSVNLKKKKGGPCFFLSRHLKKEIGTEPEVAHGCQHRVTSDRKRNTDVIRLINLWCECSFRLSVRLRLFLGSV